MSKFQSTISVCAALASIFGAGAAGFKLAQDNQLNQTQKDTEVYEQRILELEKKVEETEKPQILATPQPVTLPPAQVSLKPPTPPALPPLPPQPEQQTEQNP